MTAPLILALWFAINLSLLFSNRHRKGRGGKNLAPPGTFDPASFDPTSRKQASL